MGEIKNIECKKSREMETDGESSVIYCFTPPPRIVHTMKFQPVENGTIADLSTPRIS